MVDGSTSTESVEVIVAGQTPLQAADQRDCLLRALAAPQAPEAAHWWRRWKQSTNVDDLPAWAAHVIPGLVPHLWDWLQDDPHAGIFQGVVRRAWSEGQVRLSVARSAIDAVEALGCAPVLLAGPPMVALVARLSASIRPIPILRIVVRRSQIEAAAAALQSDGWTLSEPLPPADQLDFVQCVFFCKNDVGLLLHWRLLPVLGPSARECEAELFAGARYVEAGGIAAWLPSQEQALLAALATRTDPDPDTVPWELDAAMLPHDSVDWQHWTQIAAKYAPEAFDRLAKMRELGLRVPYLVRPEPPQPAAPVIRRIPLPIRIFRALERRARRVVRRCLA